MMKLEIDIIANRKAKQNKTDSIISKGIAICNKKYEIQGNLIFHGPVFVCIRFRMSSIEIIEYNSDHVHSILQ